MLRGLQTAGELLARSERLHRYADASEVLQILERLASRQPALSGCRAGRARVAPVTCPCLAPRPMPRPPPAGSPPANPRHPLTAAIWPDVSPPWKTRWHSCASAWMHWRPRILAEPGPHFVALPATRPCRGLSPRIFHRKRAGARDRQAAAAADGASGRTFGRCPCGRRCNGRPAAAGDSGIGSATARCWPLAGYLPPSPAWRTPCQPA